VADRCGDDAVSFDHAPLNCCKSWSAGVHSALRGSLIDFNLTALVSGDGSIDTGEASALEPRGRVAGKDHTPWSLSVEFTYHFAL
jgi:hypothetical protein